MSAHTGVCTDLIQDVCLITSKNLSMAWTSPTLLLLCKVGVAVVITVGWLVVQQMLIHNIFSYFCYVTLTLFTHGYTLVGSLID